MSFALVAFLGAMFFRSGLFDRFVDKLEVIVNHFEKDHFLKQCVNKLKALPKNPSLEEVQAALGPDFERFKKEFTNQVH